MEFLDGQTLKNHISGKPQPLEQVLHLGIEMADYTRSRPAERIIHRDIKTSEHIRYQAGLTRRILDFGLAKLVRVDEGVDVSDMPTATTEELLD